MDHSFSVSEIAIRTAQLVAQDSPLRISAASGNCDPEAVVTSLQPLYDVCATLEGKSITTWPAPVSASATEWGYSLKLATSDFYCLGEEWRAVVKLLVLLPGGRTSLHAHRRRTEVHLCLYGVIAEAPSAALWIPVAGGRAALFAPPLSLHRFHGVGDPCGLVASYDVRPVRPESDSKHDVQPPSPFPKVDGKVWTTTTHKGLGASQ